MYKLFFYLLLLPVSLFLLSFGIYRTYKYIEKFLSNKGLIPKKAYSASKPSLKKIGRFISSIVSSVILMILLPLVWVYEKLGIMKFYKDYFQTNGVVNLIPLLISTFVAFVLIDLAWKYFYYRKPKN